MRYGQLRKTLIAALAALLPCSAFAQGTASAYPNKPVRVVVGMAPGGATDIQARMFTQRMSESLGQQFIVDNRDGAGGLLAIQAVKNSNPDGYTVLAVTTSFTVVPALHSTPPYDPVKDFLPVSLVTKAPYMIIVTPSFPAKTMTEFLAYAKLKPGAINFAIPGIGTTTHLGAVWLDHSGVKVTIIPYKGAGPATMDVIAGQVNAAFASILSGLPHVKAGRVRVVAVTTSQRSKVLPDVPTVAESGVPGYDVDTWHGWLVAKGTPPAIVNKINMELAKAVRAPEMTARLAGDGGEIVVSSPAQFSQVIIKEITRWAKLVKATGLKTVDQN